MKGRPVDQVVYEYMFPRSRTSDPQNFHTLLHRHLIMEVRQEVHSFYGHLDTPEAKYPGLDYNNHIHRIRLSRWPWHRRLFRAFDGLRLTPSEISGLTKWEGTKWAKERFERDSGIVIRDTTADAMGEWVEPEDRLPTSGARLREEPEQMQDDPATDHEMDEEDSDSELESVGVALNERLRERAARHDSGQAASDPLDEDFWEQWLKTAFESGELPLVPSRSPARVSSFMPPVPEAFFPPRVLAAAREGRWDEVPDFLRAIVRHSLNGEDFPRHPRNVAAAPGSGPRAPSSMYRNLASSSWSNYRRAIPQVRLPMIDGIGRPNTTAAASTTTTSGVVPGRGMSRTAQPGA